MATITIAQPMCDEHDLSTIPDPRMRDLEHTQGTGADTPHHPDLSDEVAALSQKLVRAINLQTSLDDSLSETQHELEQSRKRVQELEGIVASQRATLEGDVWVRRSSIEPEKELLRQRIRDIRREKATAEAETKEMRDELEKYSTQVMTEAQKMVVTAKTDFQLREEHMQQRIDQLRGQVSDYEEMFKAQQEQLVTMQETMESQREQISSMKQAMDNMSEQWEGRSNSCPTSPGFSKATSGAEDDIAASTGTAIHAEELVAPVAPLSLTHLIQPALREDVSVFAEFSELVEMAKAPKPTTHSRVASGGYSGFSSLAMGLGANPYVLSQENSSNASLPASSATPTTDSNPHTPNTPASSVSATSAASPRPVQPLQSTKFFKRIVDEDIEPAVRRSSSSVMGWMTKRSISSACADGSLIIEPVLLDSPTAKLFNPQYDPCGLCGEDSRSPDRLRVHRFSTGNGTKNPLCDYCLRRIRTACELVSFLRMLKDGLWKVEDDEGLKAAWEECTRLREEMFWSRIGGGVVPAQDKKLASQPPSRRTSQDPTPVPPEVAVCSEQARDKPPERPEQPPRTDASEELAPIQESKLPPKSTVVLRQRSDSAMNARPSTPSRSQSAFKRLSLTIPIGTAFFSA